MNATRNQITVADRINYPALDKNWTPPEWLKKYEKTIVGNGEPIQALVQSFATSGPNLAKTNIIRWAICSGVDEQVRLLYRLHKSGSIV